MDGKNVCNHLLWHFRPINAPKRADSYRQADFTKTVNKKKI